MWNHKSWIAKASHWLLYELRIGGVVHAGRAFSASEPAPPNSYFGTTKKTKSQSSMNDFPPPNSLVETWWFSEKPPPSPPPTVYRTN